MIKISIVEPNEISRHGLESIIESTEGMEVVCRSSSLSSLVTLYHRFSPTISLIDLDTDIDKSIKYIKELKKEIPTSKVIAITSDKKDRSLTELLKIGIDGYINKNDNISEMINAIIQVSESNAYIRLDSMNIFIKEYMRLNTTDITLRREIGKMERREKGLTNKEYEVLQLASEGKTNSKIGYLLGISSFTVKNHFTSILRKLGTEDRTQSVVMGIKHGWVEIK